jgi:hypothetical protein
LAKDYEGTSDQPDCESKSDGSQRSEEILKTQGHWIHCNIRLKDVDRLMHVVDAALITPLDDNAWTVVTVACTSSPP